MSDSELPDSMSNEKNLRTSEILILTVLMSKELRGKKSLQWGCSRKQNKNFINITSLDLKNTSGSTSFEFTAEPAEVA